MFNKALSLILENEKVRLYEREDTIKIGGGTSIKWKFLGYILCNIQADSKYGDNLVNSESGDEVKSVYNMYTRKPVKEGQRINRDGLLYEIRNVEHNGKFTILEHYKAYLTRVTQ